MNTHKLLLLLAWLPAVNAFGQTQLSRWTLGDNNTTFDMSTPTPTSWSSMTANNPPLVKNSIHDALGRVLFYVGGWKIYDGFGNVVGNMEAIPDGLGNVTHDRDINPEFPIVPCIEEDNACKKRYYVFYTLTDYQARNLKLFAKIVTVDNNTGNIIVDDVKNAAGSRRILDYSATYATSDKWQSTGLAVSPITPTWINNELIPNTYVRHLYWVAGEVKKITIGVFNNTDYGIGSSKYIFRIYDHFGFQFNTQEADLSHDGKKLVWGTADANMTYQKFYYIELDDKGDWDGVTDEIFTLPTSTPNTVDVRGVEFTPDGRALLVSTGGFTPGVSGNHGIYRKSLIPLTSGFNFIAGTGSYGGSQLELAQNGLIYAASEESTNLGYAGVELSAFTFPNGVINSGFHTTAVSFDLYCLPDQIDGDYYVNTPINFYDVGDISFQAIGNGHITVINNTNSHLYLPHIGNRIKVRGTIQFAFPDLPNIPSPPRSTWALDALDFSMAKGSKIIVGDNVTLQLMGCSFQSADCAEMWKGIEVVGTGQIIVLGSITANKRGEFYDAETAIAVIGAKARVNIAGATFNRNSTHVKIVDYRAYNSHGLDIKDNTFLHTEPLRIFADGQQFPGSNIFGTTSVRLERVHAREPGEIVYLYLAGNRFEKGQYGIFSVGEKFIMKVNADIHAGKCTFLDITAANSAAIRLEDVSGVEIQDADFINVNQALYSKGYAELVFSNNLIDKSSNHAVEIYGNLGRNISIKKNEFRDFKLSAILLNSNAYFQPISKEGTDILIEDNTFKILTKPGLYDLHKPTGITIMEPTMGTVNQSYRSLRITHNTMTNVACGINTTTIVGTQLMNKKYNSNYSGLPTKRTDINDFDNNTISVYATFTTPAPSHSDYNTGIRLNNSNGLVTVTNKITSNQFTQWRSAGIYSDNTRQSLFYNNTVMAGRGIGATNYGMGNDIKCNTFAVGVNGISLEDYIMRLPGQIHGERLVDSRDNSFALMKKECIELYLYRKPATLIQNHIDANQWLMTSVPTTLIEPTPACSPPFINCIRQTGAPNTCGTFGQGGGDNIIYNTPPTGASGDNLYDWQLKYEYERQQKSEGLVYNSLLSTLIDVEHFIAVRDNPNALLLLNGMQSNNVYETNLITLYTILVNARLENDRPLDSPEVAIYKGIAEQNVYATGPSIYLARAVLWQQEGLNYVDMVDRNSGNIGIRLTGEGCIGQIPENFSIQLMNEDGYVYTQAEVPLSVDEEGYVFIPNTVVATLAQDLGYTFVLDNGNYPSPPFQPLADWMDNENNTIELCNNSLLGNTQNKRGTTSQEEQSTKIDESHSGVLIFPNPAKDVVTVMLPSKDEYTVAVYDIMGKKVYEQKHAQRVVLATENYKTGVYLIKVTDSKGNTLSHKKVIVHQ